MRHGLLFVLLLSAASAAGGQARPWVAPRAADGHPDLQGLWENNSATPLERPAAFAGKPRLTQPELDALKAQAARLFSADADAVFGDAFYLGILENINRGLGATGSYSGNWLPPRNFEARTSLITDPDNGKLPPMTEDAMRARAAAAASRPPKTTAPPVP